MRYNWDWGIFTQMAADGSGTWLHYLLVGLLWTLATALAAWVLALSIGSAVGTLRTLPIRWVVRGQGPTRRSLDRPGGRARAADCSGSEATASAALARPGLRGML